MLCDDLQEVGEGAVTHDRHAYIARRPPANEYPL